MKKVRLSICLVVMCMMAAVNFASADVIRGIDINFVTIGNPGNAPDTGGTIGSGAVGYTYRIGKYEVTNAQWNIFTAAAGAPTGNDGGYSNSAYYTGAQQPTNNISWYEAAQFCNYLTSGDKSKGAYQFSGNNTNPGSFVGVNRTAAEATYGTIYVLPTENEWYKAAYYKPNGSGYSNYANGTNTAPVAGVASNYDWAFNTPWNINSGMQEQNGTFDMMGNVFEWNETPFGSYLGIRGGAIANGDLAMASFRYSIGMPYTEDSIIGFRVASVVPEPATLFLLTLGGLFLRKRKA